MNNRYFHRYYAFNVRRIFLIRAQTLLEHRRTLNVNIKGPSGPFYRADLYLYDTGHTPREFHLTCRKDTYITVGALAHYSCHIYAGQGGRAINIGGNIQHFREQ